MLEFLEQLNGFVWGVPALFTILGVGLYLSVRTGFLQIRMFPHAMKHFIDQFRKSNTKDFGISSYKAVCTALAATVGTGNLAGVAGAIAIGGPGAVFWMWLCAVLGMILKFAEAVLAVYFRTKNEKGEVIGGPMYMISQGLGVKWRWLAGTYCFLGVVASFGVGNSTQVNTVINSINDVVLIYGGKISVGRNLILGCIISVLLTVLMLGGAKRIGSAAQMLVPFASVIYLFLGTGVLLLKRNAIPGAFRAIFQGAFDPKAVTGGVIGSAFLVLRTGAARGLFTNEAGMGTASIAHAGANVSHPVEQGFMGIIEVFLDTIVICTMTALVILCSGIPICYGEDVGILLTTAAFSAVYGEWVRLLICVILCLLAIATIMGWSLYGGRCAQYLFGHNAWRIFIFLQAIIILVGAIMNTDIVWTVSEIVNGLMAIPNLLALFMLTSILIKLCKEYKNTSTRH